MSRSCELRRDQAPQIRRFPQLLLTPMFLTDPKWNHDLQRQPGKVPPARCAVIRSSTSPSIQSHSTVLSSPFESCSRTRTLSRVFKIFPSTSAWTLALKEDNGLNLQSALQSLFRALTTFTSVGVVLKLMTTINFLQALASFSRCFPSTLHVLSWKNSEFSQSLLEPDLHLFFAMINFVLKDTQGFPNQHLSLIRSLIFANQRSKQS